jgi:hypothetical protein
MDSSAVPGTVVRATGCRNVYLAARDVSGAAGEDLMG